MLDGLLAGLFTGVITLVGLLLKERFEDRNREDAEKKKLSLEYLNPLRFFLEETYFRLQEIHESASQLNEALTDHNNHPAPHPTPSSDTSAPKEDQALTVAVDRCRVLYLTGKPKDISKQPTEWFIGEGVYLTSSVYFVACLFFYIKKLKEDLPYVQLSQRSRKFWQRWKRIMIRYRNPIIIEQGKNEKEKNRILHRINRGVSRWKYAFQNDTEDDDTILLNLINSVSRAFLYDNGIYYALQPAIGHKMFLESHNRVVTYDEFSQILQNPEQRVWFDRLIQYFMIASGQKYLELISAENTPHESKEEAKQRFHSRLNSLVQAVNAIGLVSVFLDKAIGGGPSINKRLVGERESQTYDSEIIKMSKLEKDLGKLLQKQRAKLFSLNAGATNE